MKNLLFIGDVVGKSGCDFLTEKTPSDKTQLQYRYNYCECRKFRSGNGVTHNSAESVIKAGADVITTGKSCFPAQGRA